MYLASCVGRFEGAATNNVLITIIHIVHLQSVNDHFFRVGRIFCVLDLEVHSKYMIKGPHFITSEWLVKKPPRALHIPAVRSRVQLIE